MPAMMQVIKIKIFFIVLLFLICYWFYLLFYLFEWFIQKYHIQTF